MGWNFERKHTIYGTVDGKGDVRSSKDRRTILNSHTRSHARSSRDKHTYANRTDWMRKQLAVVSGCTKLDILMIMFFTIHMLMYDLCFIGVVHSVVVTLAFSLTLWPQTYKVASFHEMCVSISSLLAPLCSIYTRTHAHNFIRLLSLFFFRFFLTTFQHIPSSPREQTARMPFYVI